MSEPVLTFPNQLTILRMICAPMLVALTLEGRLRAAVAVFLFAAVTDVLDGVIARVYGLRTEVGAILDPLADKMLLGSAFVALSFAHMVPVRIPRWLTVIVLSRDAIIVASVLAIALVTHRRSFSPSRLGKITTAAQVLCASLTFIANRTPVPGVALDIVFAATGVITVGSGLHYLYRASSRQFALKVSDDPPR